MKSSFFPWKDDYRLGIEEIDNQHMKLFEIINRLFDSFMARTSDEKLNEILNELIDYTLYHFTTEEAFQCKINYPKIKDHQALHEAFKIKVLDFKSSFDKGNKITTTVMNFLRKWLDEHILKVDHDLIKYLK